jgi:hypothetical protein
LKPMPIQKFADCYSRGKIVINDKDAGHFPRLVG